MKLTTRQLRQIIKEEVQAAAKRKLLKEALGPYGLLLTALDILMNPSAPPGTMIQAAAEVTELMAQLPDEEQAELKELSNKDLKEKLKVKSKEWEQQA